MWNEVKKLNRLIQDEYIECEWDGEWGYILIDHTNFNETVTRTLGIDEEIIEGSICETEDGLYIDLLPIAAEINRNIDAKLIFSQDRKVFYVEDCVREVD